MKIRKIKYVIGLAFILLGLGIILATSLPKSMQYYVTVDELMKDQNKYKGKELKVAGKVKKGTLLKEDSTLTWDFQIYNQNDIIAVHYQGAMPDTFKEEADVVITGTVQPSGEISATHVLAKCASRYEEKLKPTL